MIAHSVRRVRRNHRAQWSSFLLRCVMKESSNSFVWILFSPFPSLRFPTYAFPPNWAVLRTVVKCLHAHPCQPALSLLYWAPVRYTRENGPNREGNDCVVFFLPFEVIKREKMASSSSCFQMTRQKYVKASEDSCYFINVQHSKIS